MSVCGRKREPYRGGLCFLIPKGVCPPGSPTIYPGQFVKIRLKGYIRTDAILIPQRAVQQSPKGTFVNVVDSEDKIEVREVHATGWKESDWLIEDGLQPGERVVVEGFHRIQPGVQVNPVPFQNGESSSRSPRRESLTGTELTQETS